MGGRNHSLIAEIERDGLNSSADLADALRKCISLAGKVGSHDLRSWATRELRGYGLTDRLPEYRKVQAPIFLDGISMPYQITAQRISPSQLPDVAHGKIDETVELVYPIGQIQDLWRQARENGKPALLSLPGGAELAQLMNIEVNNRFQSVHRLYWAIDGSSLGSVLDNVRTTLVELVAALRQGMAGDDDAVPSPELTAQAVSIAVFGERSRVTIRDVNVADRGGRVETRTGAKSGRGRLARMAGILTALLTLAAAAAKLMEMAGLGVRF